MKKKMIRMIEGDDSGIGNIDDIFTCLLGLNALEKDVFHIIENHPGITCEGIAKKVKLTRTPVQRAAKHILDMGLITRRNESLPNAGYQYHYHVRDRRELKQFLETIVEATVMKMRILIDDFFG
ncbi:winged helix-turn-helix transcriptional regulator [Candidatus Bathyarchaeota archaeon]|nr:winged helix-turn-helix transcriptional regulator [Candidatus Bathyarchaeota archaeon]